MATYAIGDIQGCYQTLQKLLERIDFDPARDRLWSVGDLVNRGPDSLGVLRWAKSLGERLIAVLGNHDLHLISRAQGIAKAKKSDTLEAVLAAPDCKELIHWLRNRPLCHREGPWILVHAGVAPTWTLAQIEQLAREAEDWIRGPDLNSLLRAKEASKLQHWTDSLSGINRLQMAVQIFTRIRICQPNATMAFNFSGPPQLAPLHYFPWFAVPGRKNTDSGFVFGHWASLGFLMKPGLIATDSGCVWGNALTAVRLVDLQVCQEPCVDPVQSKAS